MHLESKKEKKIPNLKKNKRIEFIAKIFENEKNN